MKLERAVKLTEEYAIGFRSVKAHDAYMQGLQDGMTLLIEQFNRLNTEGENE